MKSFLLGVVAMFGAFAASAKAGSAVELTVVGYADAETLKDFPVPVRLSEKAVPGFRSAGAKGVAFSDEEGRPLPSEVEIWNPGGESLVWVRVPELKKGTKFFVEVESTPRQDNSVWQGYAGVWHFAEPSGVARDSAAGRDAVPAGGPGTNAMVRTEGPGGYARVLAGKEAAFFTVENSERLKLGGRFSFSGWIRGDNLNPFKLVRLVTRSADKWGWTGGGGWGLALNGPESLQIDGSKNRVFATVPNCADGAWHHLCVSFEGTNVTVAVDGEPRAIARGRIEPPDDPEVRMQFGWRTTTPSNPITFRGAVDEFRLKAEPVSAAWAKAEYESLTNPQFVIAKGVKVVGAKPRRGRKAKEDPGLPVIPRVTSWKAAGGHVKVGSMVKGEGPEAQSVARLLTDDMSLTKAAGNAESAVEVRLSVNPKVSSNPEGYRMEIAADGVKIVGATRQGLYWGTRTLLQLLDAAPDKRTLVCGVIIDAPKYRRRGFMLDVGRKFFPLDYLKDVAKTMAYYKMNDFHIHLNDNGGKEIADSWDQIYSAFRMECETYPGLTAKDNFYRKDEFRQFIKDAAKLGVQVVPEFDAPAHSLAFTRYRPDFEKKDHDPAHIELKNPDVIPFFEKLWAEYLGGDDPVFAGPVVHVGSDEYWAKEAELFRTFLDRMLAVVQSYGKTPRAWGSLEHCRGLTPVRSKGVELDIWYNPYYSPAAALRAGYKIIAIQDNELYICPACGYYNDYLNLPMLYKYWEPCYIGNDEVTPDEPNLLGGAFAVWNDHIGNGISCDDVTDRAFPAAQVLAEKLWHGTDKSLAYEDFAKIADSTAEAPGVNQRDRVKLAADGTADLASSPAIGWSQQGGWTVSFDLTLEPVQPKDAPLFDDGTTLVSANLGGTGRFGFRRDGYDCLFKDPLPTGRTLAVKMTGDPKGTSLFLDGKLVERLQKPMRVITKKGYKMAQVETMHFPLVRAKNAKAKVENFVARSGL